MQKQIARRETFRRRAALVLAAFGLAAVLLAIEEWDAQRRTAPVAAQPDKPVPAPNAPAWKLATVPTPPWEPNAARNSRNLYAAFEQARKLDRPDAWLVAADIAGACDANAISPAQRNRLAEERGAWNSTQAGQPDRDAKLADLQKREAALAELEQRCKGFRGTDSESIAVIKEELREKAKRSDTDLGRLLRTLWRAT